MRAAEGEPVTSSGEHQPAVTPLAAQRAAGQHARRRHRDYLVRGVGAVVFALVLIVLSIVVFGLGWIAVVSESVAIAAMLVVDAKATPLIRAWRQGAEGEERVGRVLEGLYGAGWYALRVELDEWIGDGPVSRRRQGLRPVATKCDEVASSAMTDAPEFSPQRLPSRMPRRSTRGSSTRCAVSRVRGHDVDTSGVRCLSDRRAVGPVSLEMLAVRWPGRL